jgi:hypothetical protein
MVEGFIALLKVAVTVAVGHAPLEPLKGATETTVGGVRVALVPALSGSLHPAAIMSSRNTAKQTLGFLYPGMTVILLPPGSTAAAQ